MLFRSFLSRHGQHAQVLAVASQQPVRAAGRGEGTPRAPVVIPPPELSPTPPNPKHRGIAAESL
eukprot:COSAG04_NODE_24397_length_322_cov_1.264574_1_plen_63_part_01